MSKLVPVDLAEAVLIGIGSLSNDSKAELLAMGTFNPHLKYDTDFINVVGSAVGIIDKENARLLQDIAVNHADQLHFLETDGETVEIQAAIRVILLEMARSLGAVSNC